MLAQIKDFGWCKALLEMQIKDFGWCEALLEMQIGDPLSPRPTCLPACAKLLCPQAMYAPSLLQAFISTLPKTALQSSELWVHHPEI